MLIVQINKEAVKSFRGTLVFIITEFYQVLTIATMQPSVRNLRNLQKQLRSSCLEVLLMLNPCYIHYNYWIGIQFISTNIKSAVLLSLGHPTVFWL